MGVRIGFIGTGGISVSHLINLAQIPDAEVVALSDLTAERAKQAQESTNKRLAERGGDGWSPIEAAHYDDYRAMLRKEKLDAVYICLPPFAHGEPEETAIEAGVAMMVEKPLALDLGLAARLHERIQERGLIAASGYQLRYIQGLQVAKERLAGRTIGMVVVMRFGSTPGTPWYHIQAKSGGQLIEMATHEMDLARLLAGDVKSVYAEADTLINNKNNPEYDIFDVNCMTLRFENGAVGTFSNNFISGHGVPSEGRGVHVIAEGLTVSYTHGGPIRLITSSGTEEIPPEGSPMAVEDRAFVEAVKTGNPALLKSTYESGIYTLATTLAGDLSAREHRPVFVKDLLREKAPALVK